MAVYFYPGTSPGDGGWWDRDSAQPALYPKNIGDRVGIGTEQVDYRLTVKESIANSMAVQFDFATAGVASHKFEISDNLFQTGNTGIGLSYEDLAVADNYQFIQLGSVSNEIVSNSVTKRTAIEQRANSMFLRQKNNANDNQAFIRMESEFIQLVHSDAANVGSPNDLLLDNNGFRLHNRISGGAIGVNLLYLEQGSMDQVTTRFGVTGSILNRGINLDFKVNDGANEFGIVVAPEFITHRDVNGDEIQRFEPDGDVIFRNAGGLNILFQIENNGRIRTNQADGTATVGAQVNRFPIYNAAGTLIGYVPIYAAA